jgi:hypothetical protein
MYIPRPAKLLFTVGDGWNCLLDSNGDYGWQHITFTMPHLLWPFFKGSAWKT